MESKRLLIYYRNYFWELFNDQTEKVKDKENPEDAEERDKESIRDKSRIL